jgi:hypothetical protein
VALARGYIKDLAIQKPLVRPEKDTDCYPYFIYQTDIFTPGEVTIKSIAAVLVLFGAAASTAPLFYTAYRYAKDAEFYFDRV